MAKAKDKKVEEKIGSDTNAKKVEAKPEDNTVYTFGKPYRVRAEHNKRTWEHLQPVLMKGAPFKQMVEACKYADENGSESAHTDFVGYLIRNGNIARKEA